MTMKKRLEFILGWCVRRAFEREHPVVIGVAGSVGKSSAKTAIGIALGEGEEGSGVVASKKNYNNELGVPLTVFGGDMPRRNPFAWGLLLAKALLTAVGAMRLRAKIFVLEMATDRPGDLAYLTRIARPHVGVLTAIGPEHTEFFGSVEGVAKEEAAILAALGKGGVAVVNADDPRVREVADLFPAKKITFGTSPDAMVRILSTTVVADPQSPEASGLEMKIAFFGTTDTVFLAGTAGRPQAYAAASALGVTFALDHEDRDAIERLRSRFHGMPGRMRLLEGIKHTWLIDDSYNSSPLAALSAIRDLAAFPVRGDSRRIAALGDMLELGNLSESSHTDVGRAVADAGIDILVACGTLAHVVAKAACDSGLSDGNVFTFAKSSEAGWFIQERLKPGDVVLVKGSQGARMEKIAKELMAHPDKAAELLVRQTTDWLARS